MSAFSCIFSSETNFEEPSFRSLGGSFKRTFIPKISQVFATLEPTCPTPTIPMVLSFSSNFFVLNRKIKQRKCIGLHSPHYSPERLSIQFRHFYNILYQCGRNRW